MKQNKKEGIILTIGIIALVIGIFTIITNFKDIFSGKPKNLNTMIENDYNISDSSLVNSTFFPSCMATQALL